MHKTVYSKALIDPMEPHMTQKNDLIITAALPYANGDIHLGHLVEYIQADICARFHRLQGRKAYYICGSDAHGTPIMLKAAENNETPEALTERVRENQMSDLASFGVQFDHFYSTHSAENERLVGEIYAQLCERGDIIKKTISQAYDAEADMFLPDRYVKGTCPRCGAPDQYGDNCEQCGASYGTDELIDARSVVSGQPPIMKDTQHFFFDLERHRDFLLKWLASDALPTTVANKLKEWFQEELRPWDISRDAPYFGFPIPGEKDKFFYVWLDAPIGYMASFEHFCQEHGLDFQRFWENNSTTDLYHFIGKDIAYFHGLFWPAILHASEHRLPTRLFVHGYLTINGQKMSKSRGHFISAKEYAAELSPTYLRYYFATKINTSADDIDFSLQDFQQRVNADLVGKYINIASRSAGFLRKHFDNTLANELHNPALFNELVAAGDEIAAYYDNMQLAKAMRCIMALADKVNQYIDEQAPWVLAKATPIPAEVQGITSMGIHAFQLLTTYLAPVLPQLSARVCEFLQIDELCWESRGKPRLGQRINKFKALLPRITDESIAALLPTKEEVVS